MTLERLRRLIDRRVRYRITRAGILFTAALALTGAGAFVSANNLLFLIFSAMLALMLVSGFLSRLVLSGLELELLLPEHVCARTATPARVRLRNLKRLTPSFSIELAAPIMAAPLYFPLLPGGKTIEATTNVIFSRRGRHKENLFVITTGFPFGFLRKTTTVALRRETIVYPSLEPRETFESMMDELTGEIEANTRGVGLDFYRIRPYEITDSARLVDWKSTAHTGAMQVREFSRDRQPSVQIFFDRRIPQGQSAWFEDAVERCAFLVLSLTEKEADLTFESQRYSCAIPAEGDLCTVLRYLALIEPLAVTGGLPETSGDPAPIRIVISAQPAQFERDGWFDGCHSDSPL